MVGDDGRIGHVGRKHAIDGRTQRLGFWCFETAFGPQRPLPGRAHQAIGAALKTNAVFSGLCGLALMIAPRPWAELIGLPWPWILVALGVGLTGFAALAMHAAGDVIARRTPVIAIIAADTLWVTASPVVMLTGAGTLTGHGHALIALVAAIVAALAAAQWTGLRILRPGQFPLRRRPVARASTAKPTNLAPDSQARIRCWFAQPCLVVGRKHWCVLLFDCIRGHE